MGRGKNTIHYKKSYKEKFYKELEANASKHGYEYDPHELRLLNKNVKSSAKMKAFELTLNEGDFYIDTDLTNISTIIDNADTEIGDVFELVVIEITQKEFDELPEFDGF